MRDWEIANGLCEIANNTNMDKLTQGWIEATKSAIESLQRKYKLNRGMLLTEGDLECHLFHELLQQPVLSGFHLSKNDSFWGNDNNALELRTTFVHSQVTWFKPQKKSGFEIDITIGDPAKLEVINIELFEEYTHKGFAYDGECVAIELKFIRSESNAKSQATEDLIHLRDNVIPAKLKNIIDQKYKISTSENIAFVTVVGCKDEKIFNTSKAYIGKQLCNDDKMCPGNLLVCLFYQDEIIWDKSSFIKAHHEFEACHKQ